MKMKRALSLTALALPVLLALCAAAQAVRSGPSADVVADETAKFIAGIPCQSEPLKKLQDLPEWRNFAERLEKSWVDLETKRLLPMRDWAGEELVGANQETRTVFYPFGGPDLLTPLILFPNADTYVLLGLEFVGHLPDFDKAGPANVQAYFDNLTAALSDFVNKSYFITHNMDATLMGSQVDGVLPLLGFFLKRTGFAIASIKRVELLDKGEIIEYDPDLVARKVRRPYGTKIEFFAPGTDRIRTAYYFSADLADAAFKKDSSFHAFLEGLPFETTFLKSASYLPHYREFTNIRNLILAKSRFVLEDDTGIPFKYFPADVWTGQLYGEYIKPIADFKGVEQEDLKAAYDDPSRVKKLPFHLGYHWSTNKDSVLYFRKK
jgi:hypothetical protein